MNRKSYWLVVALLAAVMALAACGGSGTDAGTGGTGSGTTEEGAAPNVPASDATVAAQGGDAAGDAAGSDAVSEGANGSNDATGAGDASGGNAGNDAGAATDVGSGSDGAQGSGGSNGAGGTTSPESDLGAPAGDETGNAQSGTGDAGGTGDTDAGGTDAGGTDAGGADAGGTGGTAGGTDASGTDAGGAATGTGQNDAQVAGSGGAYTPVAEADCTALQEQLTTALGVDVTRGTNPAAFSDLSGGVGESCQLTITGTGEQFPSLADAAQRIGQVFTGAGWTADPQYAADGPTGTIGGLRRDNQLAAYNVEWQPGPAASCPADQPMATCLQSLAPDQVVYNITVDLAQQ